MGIASQLSFSTATSVRGGALGSIPYQSATSSTVFVSIGAAGTVLQSNGTAPIWAPAGGTTVGTSTQVQTVLRTTNANHFLTFVDSNNASATAETVYTTSTIFVNPTLGRIDATMFSAATTMRNSGDYFEKVFPAAVVFPNAVANQAVDIRIGNVSVWGYIEVEVNSSFSNQNSAGKLTKLFAIGTNPSNLIYTNESRLVDMIGTIPANIAIGEFQWDAANTTYKIPVSHIVSSGNDYTIKVRCFGFNTGADVVLGAMTLSSVYTLTALAAHTGVYYNSNLIVGSTSTIYKFDVNGETGIRGANYLYMGHSEIGTNWSSRIRSSSGQFQVDAGSFRIADVGYTGLITWISGSTTGNVGIGTASPTSRLTVTTSTNSATTTASSIALHLFNSASDGTGGRANQTGIGFGGSTTRSAIVAGTFGNDYLDFFNNGDITTPRIRIRATGAIAFSGTNTHGSSGQILQSNGDAAPTWVNASGLGAGSSAQVNTIQRTTNASHFLTFVDSNNASATAETVYTTSSFAINPQSGNISVGGSITASTVGSTFALGIAAPSQSGSESIAHIAGGSLKIDANRSFAWDGTFPTSITGVSGAGGSITINAGNSGVPVQFLSQGVVNIQSTTAATSTITGALRVVGGVGIRGDLWVGGTINTLIGSTGQVNTIQRTTNAVHYLTFVDSNNATATAETIYTTSSFNINPQSGNVGIGTTSTIGFWGTSQTTARTRIDFSNASTSIDTAAPILALTNADQTVANLTSIVLGTLNGAGGNPIGQAAIYSVNATTNRASPLGSIGFATANISGTMVERVRISEVGNLILNGNAAGGGNSIVLRGGTAASSEGPQITMGYGNNTSSAITGQANNSWNIDIASGLANNNFRIFRQNSAGATVVAAEFTEASGGVQLVSVGVGTTSSGVTGEIRATNEITAYFSSDIRLKENIRLIADPITIVNQIRGVYYDWTDEHIKARGGEDGYFVRKHDIGVIAQEVEKVLPEIVAERDDGTKVVKYEKLVALLIEAVKDQQRQINQISQALQNLAIK
jgi:hypothetical protein